MVSVVRRSLILAITLGGVSLSGGSGFALAQVPTVPATVETPAGTKPDEGERPLPDIPALMHAVEANQKKYEAVAKDYLYRSVVTEEASDGHGGVKKS
jgi:hypothetical protein